MNLSAIHPLRCAPAPIFVVGSPRSGTSILTWCLGRHSNLLALEESGWMGDLAADLGARFAAGSRRGERSQLAAMGLDRDTFMAEFGAAIDHLVARYRSRLPDAFEIGGKTRWIDGTPEYSLHICGLHKLFPSAKFVHIVRDVDAVAASMLNFHRLNGERLVVGPAHAYAYWKATVEACLAAERALGSDVVHRLRYADLVERPEAALGGILGFLGEPYEAACRRPLRIRINSSNVPADFVVDTSRIDSDLLRTARELSRSLQETPGTEEAFGRVSARFAEAFEERVDFVAALDGEYAAAQGEVARLNAELDRSNAWALACDETIRQRDALIVGMRSELAASNRWALHLDRVLGKFGAVLILQCLLLIGVRLAGAAGLRAAYWLAMPVCLGTSLSGALAFAWMRRARLLRVARAFLIRL